MPETVGSPSTRPPNSNSWTDYVNHLLEELGLHAADQRQLIEALDHAEGQAAAWLRNSPLRLLVLDINNDYVCRACLEWLWKILPRGKTLIIRFNSRFGRVDVMIRGGEGWWARLVY
jgi:hypothetical protein